MLPPTTPHPLLLHPTTSPLTFHPTTSPYHHSSTALPLPLLPPPHPTRPYSSPPHSPIHPPTPRYVIKMRVALKEQENSLAQERQLAIKKAQTDMQSAVETALAERDELLSLYSKVCGHLVTYTCSYDIPLTQVSFYDTVILSLKQFISPYIR